MVSAVLSRLPSRGKVSARNAVAPGDLALEACSFEAHGKWFAAERGTLVVPENRAKPGSRLITLPVMRIRSAAGRPGEPIFYLAGGPGASNMTFKPPLALLANHDFVMVGYRGVDGPVRLESPEFARALRDTGGDLLSAGARARLGGAARQCAQRWQAAGVDLDGYTMPEVVADMEMARAALGYPRIHLLSVSYGTRLAQIYAYLHPDRIYRSAMLGVNPPGRFVWEPETIDRQLQYYARLCAQAAARGSGSPDLAETIREVVHHMPRRWLCVPIDPGKVKAATFVLLFHRGTAALVFDAYRAAAAGDAGGLALMSLAFDALMASKSVWGEFFAKGGTADFDPTRDYAADMNPPGSIMGSPLSLVYFDSLKGNWPMTPIPAELRRVQPSDVETLLVSGSVDFSTPGQYATHELLPALRRGREVIVAEAGHVHDLVALQPAAADRLLTSFYDTGVADDSVFRYMPMDFRVRLGFPRLAKLLAAASVLLIGAGAGLAGLILRKVLRPA